MAKLIAFVHTSSIRVTGRNTCGTRPRAVRAEPRTCTWGPELEKARQEVENYQRFTALCRQLVEVNEQICQLRPVPEVADVGALEQLKKKLQRMYAGRSSRK